MKTESHSPELVEACRRWAQLSVVGVLILGLIVLAGWALDNHHMTSLFPTLAADAGVPNLGQVHSSAAICMVLLSSALLMIMAERFKWVRAIGYTLATIPLGVGLLNMYLEFTGDDIDPLRFFQPNEMSPGITFPVPMVIQVSACTITLALGLFLYRVKIKNVYPTQLIAIFSIICPILVLGGASTKVQKLCVFGRCYTPSVGYAALVLFFAFALFLSRPTVGVAAAFTSRKPGGIIMRRATSLLLIPFIYLFCTIPSYIMFDGSPMFNLGTCKVLAFAVVAAMVGSLAWSGFKVANELEDRLVETSEELERTRQSRTGNLDGESTFTRMKYKKVCLVCTAEYGDSLETCPVDGNSLDRIIDDSLVGSLFVDKYQVSDMLGTGGMSAVYKAMHTVIGREVAIKVLNDKTASSGDGLKRFQREARAMGNLQHPGIVGISDFGISLDGRAYLVMDYVEGECLSALLERGGPLNVQTTAVIACQLCDALSHAHGHGVVHRDLKPSNIMLIRLPNGSIGVKVVDFGLAKMVADEDIKQAAITQTGECVGSPLYMSPEQCKGEPLDPRTDIYALGCILFECLTGVPPIVGRNVVATVKAHVSEKPREFPANCKVPAAIRVLVYRCLEKQPSDRPRSALEVKQVFAEFARDSLPQEMKS